MAKKWRRRNGRLAAALLSAGLLSLGGARGAAGADGWIVTPLADPAAYEALAAETGARAPDGLPDGFIAEAEAGVTDVARAWYADPTTRYAHGVIGDSIEAAALIAETPAGARLRLDLPDDQVFEDRTPRVVDLDGDGRADIIAIRASRSGGAAVAVFGVQAGRLRLRAATPEIGRPNRWLNIAALSDLAGLGRRQIAYVQTPHIGGTLHLYDFDGADLRRLDSLFGFSNHAIGARELRLSALIPGDGSAAPELAVPDASRRRLRIMAVAAGGWRERASIALPARLEGPLLRAQDARERARARLWTRLADGRVYEIARP